MICGPTCRPSFETLSLRLPTASQARLHATWGERFSEIRAGQPVSSPAWKMRAIRGTTHFELRLSPSAAANLTVKQPYFYSGDGHIRSNAPQEVTRTQEQFVLRLPRSEFGPKTSRRLTGILQADSSWERDRDCRSIHVDVEFESK